MNFCSADLRLFARMWLTLLDVVPMVLLQPVIQYYANVGGGTRRAVVFGFRAKVDF